MKKSIVNYALLPIWRIMQSCLKIWMFGCLFVTSGIAEELAFFRLPEDPPQILFVHTQSRSSEAVADGYRRLDMYFSTNVVKTIVSNSVNLKFEWVDVCSLESSSQIGKPSTSQTTIRVKQLNLSFPSNTKILWRGKLMSLREWDPKEATAAIEVHQ
jgi:hypothetical protein